MVTNCLVCDTAIWQPSEGHLCRLHRYERERLSVSIAFCLLRVAVEIGTRSDFYFGWGHREAQTNELATRPQHWVLAVGDVLRIHGHWLDAWGDGGMVA